jgi:hypothetical protein
MTSTRPFGERAGAMIAGAIVRIIIFGPFVALAALAINQSFHNDDTNTQYRAAIDAVASVRGYHKLPVLTQTNGIAVFHEGITGPEGGAEHALELDTGLTEAIDQSFRTKPGEIPRAAVILSCYNLKVGECIGACPGLHDITHEFCDVSVLDMRTGEIKRDFGRVKRGSEGLGYAEAVDAAKKNLTESDNIEPFQEKNKP